MMYSTIRFGDLYAVDSRNGLSKPIKIRGSGYKMINMGELFANDRIYDIPMELVPLKDSEKNNAKVEVGDLLFARQSLVFEGAGKCSIVMEVSPLTVFESHLIRVRLKDNVNPVFYYYYFRSTLSPMKSIVSQCAQAGIRGRDLQELNVLFPPKNVQDKIANILKKYDELIENNNKQIKLLEEAAQRLYKEWFVDLRFPGYEQTEIIDGIPKDWEKKLIGDIIGKISRTKQIKTSDYLAEGAIPVVDQSRDFIAGYTNDEDSVVNLGIPIIVFGDHTRILKYIQFPFAKGADGTQLIISDKDNMPQSLLYLSLKAVDLSNYHYARHFKYLKAEIILIPTKEIGDKFDRIVSPMLSRIQKLRDICNKSSQARDGLLPKLLGGEIEV
ncbi:restriction endonuclease subunit S [Coprococcus sp. AF38-1]|jgi:type I restriction enzyme S subunit|uniref:restriction endonuclease subunit S n=1 Tax=Coprococcus sp. AF38-1 TaxID=2302943 RepID=UPI000E726DC8|nr:restriction endonuclease subunit S [Coprococcus sp. AF38-1]RJW74102.1 restriction endonuclease subunit S [Coprococcus sp. AF38-1]